MNVPRWSIEGRSLNRDGQPAIFLSRSIGTAITPEEQDEIAATIVMLLNDADAAERALRFVRERRKAKKAEAQS